MNRVNLVNPVNPVNPVNLGSRLRLFTVFFIIRLSIR
jgi:hypothetical protein